jgi:acyl-CoA thioesterase I
MSICTLKNSFEGRGRQSTAWLLNRVPVAANMMKALVLVLIFCLPAAARAETITILALGDSLTAGLGLDPGQAFPARLEAALKAKGHDVAVQNAGVSGDTSSAGRDRLGWALTDDIDAVIVELGANDALRGIDPAETRKALEAILSELDARKLPVLIAGMRAPINLGPDYAAKFDPIFAELAAAHGDLLYPFYLDGVAAEPSLNQPDGIHPNAQGVDLIVGKILPKAEELIGLAQK